MARSETVDELEQDIDVRLMNLVIEALFIEEWTPEAIMAFLRAAYGKGYVDALREDKDGNRAKLCLDHGYRAL